VPWAADPSLRSPGIRNDGGKGLGPDRAREFVRGTGLAGAMLCHLGQYPRTGTSTPAHTADRRPRWTACSGRPGTFIACHAAQVSQVGSPRHIGPIEEGGFLSPLPVSVKVPDSSSDTAGWSELYSQGLFLAGQSRYDNALAFFIRLSAALPTNTDVIVDKATCWPNLADLGRLRTASTQLSS